MWGRERGEENAGKEKAGKRKLGKRKLGGKLVRPFTNVSITMILIKPVLELEPTCSTYDDILIIYTTWQ